MRREEIFNIVSNNFNGTILSAPERGPWGNSNYRGNCSGWIPAAIIYRYGIESVAEIFAGGGTTSDLCKDLGIKYVGVDINPTPVRNDIVSMNILDNDVELPELFYQADLQFLHPPYPSINDVRYCNNMWKGNDTLAKQDIQNMSWKDGMNAINKAILRGYTAMPSGSYQAILVGDIRSKGQFRSMMSELAIPGEMVQVLIKAQHNTVSGRNGSTYGGSKRNFFFLEHEYVVVIKKPSGYEVAYVIPKEYRLDIRDSVMASWDDVIMTAMRKLNYINGLDNLYREIDGHKKCKDNPHWKEKLRQRIRVLCDKGLLLSKERGCYQLAS